jgi:hypothetical protein
MECEQNLGRKLFDVFIEEKTHKPFRIRCAGGRARKSAVLPCQE